MNALLDTHIALWWLADNPRLSEAHREIISNAENLCYVSAATIWEISIKSVLGKLVIADAYIDVLRRGGFLELPINWTHTQRVRELPLLHSDPFDRVLIAQAQIEEMILLSADENIKRYDVSVI
jgi:PIN domain nuclease of toxin-antitoxin system